MVFLELRNNRVNSSNQLEDNYEFTCIYPTGKFIRVSLDKNVKAFVFGNSYASGFTEDYIESMKNLHTEITGEKFNEKLQEVEAEYDAFIKENQVKEPQATQSEITFEENESRS